MMQLDALDRRKVVARLLRDRKNLLLVTGLGSPLMTLWQQVMMT